jgi:hypothetical protein
LKSLKGEDFTGGRQITRQESWVIRQLAEP